MDDPVVKSKLLELLKDSDPRVRALAAKNLDKYGDYQTTQRLIELLVDKAEFILPGLFTAPTREIVNVWVAEALEKIGTPEAKSALSKANL
jgi:HEAT repeat protein